ncbi:hypothetical protein D3C75_578610 [compost metagenome]
MAAHGDSQGRGGSRLLPVSRVAQPRCRRRRSQHQPVLQGSRCRAGLPAGLAPCQQGQRRCVCRRQRRADSGQHGPIARHPGQRYLRRHSPCAGRTERSFVPRWRICRRFGRWPENPPGSTDRHRSNLCRLGRRGRPARQVEARYSPGKRRGAEDPRRFQDRQGALETGRTCAGTDPTQR